MNQRLAIIILLWQLSEIYGKLELSDDGEEGCGKMKKKRKTTVNFFYCRVREAESSSRIKYRDRGAIGLGNTGMKWER